MTGEKGRKTTVRKLWIGVGLLALLSPLGLVLPKLFHGGGAWGEWGLDELRSLLGYLPAGMEKTGNAWNAPLPDYSVADRQGGPLHEGLWYVASAVLGIAAVAFFAWLLSRAFSRRNTKK